MAASWVTTLRWAALYAAAVILGRQLVLEQSGLALFWPAAGVATLWFLVEPRPTWGRVAAVLLVVTSLLNMALGSSVPAGVLFGVANVVQAGCAAWLFRRWTPAEDRERVPGLRSQRELVLLAAACLTAALASSVPGTTAGWLTSGHWSWLTWTGWVARNVVGAVLVLVVVLVAVGARRAGRAGMLSVPRLASRDWAGRELVVASVVSGVVLFSVFGRDTALPLAFLVITTGAWVGSRFEPWVAAGHASAQALGVIALTLAGLGPFGALAGLNERALVAQCFVVVNLVLALLLAIGAAEREHLLLAARRAEAKARAQADLLTAVSDVMRDGLLVLDSGGRVVHVNPAAYDLTGLAADQQVNLDNVAEHGFAAPDGRQLARSELPHTRALAGERVEAMDVLRLSGEGGREQVLSVTGTSMRYVDDEPMAVMGVRDVTAERLEKRELEAFAGVVAHDLMNPISAVLSWCEILDEQLDPLPGGSDARSSLVRIYTASERMQQLIADLLSYARAGSGALDLQPLNLEAIMTEVAGSLGLELANSGATSAPSLQVEARDFVLADAVLVRQLMTNLVANAVKYVAATTAPHVIVSSRLTDGVVEVSVTDNGIGIPSEDRTRVFDSFYRASNTGTFPGTGLGLAICARAVERHGGTIAVAESAQGMGTRVVLTLPMAAVEPCPGQTPTSGVAPSTRAVPDAGPVASRTR